MRNRRLIIDMTGKTYGRYKVLRYYGKDKSGRPAWEAQCECGTIKIVRGSALREGSTVSCGCYQKSLAADKQRKPIGENCFHTLYLRYRYNAKKRNLEFSLTKEEFRSLVLQSCHYCGKEPSQLVRSKEGLVKRGANGNFTYTGIDRKNNDLGYNNANCVPACKECNSLKRKRSYEEFINSI